MSELKATTAQEIVQNEKDCDYMDELFGGVKMPPTQVYLKSDVDKVLAEKDEEIRSIHRALYKACANWAHVAVAFFSSYATKEPWHKMESKCLKKVEEFK